MSQRLNVRPTSVVAEQRSPLDTGADVVAVSVWPAEAADNGFDGPWIGPGGAEVSEALNIDLTDALDRESATGKAGEVVSVPVYGAADLTRVLLIGVGDGSTTAYRRAGAALARATRGVDRVTSMVTAAADDAGVRAFVEGAVLATYRRGGFRRAADKDAKQPAGELSVIGAGPGVVARATSMASAAWFARDLVHTPSNLKNPAWLAEQAERLGRDAGLDVHVRDERALANEGFGGIVGVGMGSASPPRLIALRYEPAAADARDAADDLPHVVFVGKGITFDSGGLSLKPRDSMVPMKTDMSGGAVVLGVMSALRALDIPVRVTGLVAAAENMPSGSAQRPGDVVTQYDGTTVEVLNTDAEGRLVLADAIAYAVAELEPTVIVDIATLTGAATMALGRTHAALYAPSDDLADGLIQAGSAAGERLWRMPLVADYVSSLESSVADVAHISTTKVSGGSITAALFLRRFTGDVTWAHLDIAGPGRADKDKDDVVKGGTAFSTRALLYWLESLPRSSR